MYYTRRNSTVPQCTTGQAQAPRKPQETCIVCHATICLLVSPAHALHRPPPDAVHSQCLQTLLKTFCGALRLTSTKALAMALHYMEFLTLVSIHDGPKDNQAQGNAKKRKDTNEHTWAPTEHPMDTPRRAHERGRTHHSEDTAISYQLSTPTLSIFFINLGTAINFKQQQRHRQKTKTT